MQFCFVNAVVSLLWRLYYDGQERKHRVRLTRRGFEAPLCDLESLLLLFLFLFNLSALHPRLQFSSLVSSIIQKTLI